MRKLNVSLTQLFQWCMGVSIALLVTAAPYGYYRWHYADHKRLREVVPGRVYRSGQLTATGIAEAVQRLNLRTVINLQDEYPDPDVARSFFDRSNVKEKALCEQLGVRYVFIPPDLVPPNRSPAEHPKAIDQFLAVMDDPTVYPVLIHCRAGLHRTGVLTAVYRMEYQKWSTRAAFRELKANGFGDSTCNSANEYVVQYVLSYIRRDDGSSLSSQASENRPNALTLEPVRLTPDP